MNAFESVEFVFLDLGKTLLGDPRLSAWKTIAREGVPGIPVDGTTLAEALTRADAEIDSAEVSHFFGEREIAEEALRLAGVKPRPDLADRLWRGYRRQAIGAYQAEGRLRPLCGADLQLLLNRIRSSGRGLGIISNERRWALRMYFRILNIERQSFDVVLVADGLGFGKPDPRIFRLAVERSGSEPDRVLYVGDSVEKDMVPAASVGMQTALFTGLLRHSDPRDWRPAIDDLAQLEVLLALPFS